MDLFGNESVAALSLTFTFFQLLCGIGIGRFISRSLTSSADRWITVWVIYDAITHFTVEAAYLYMTLHGTIENFEGPIADFWKEYGKADARWIKFDENIVALELLTVGFCAPVCIWLAYAIVKNKPYRHFLQITLCVCELYGGWMTFAPEWVTGSQALNTSNPLYLWVYLVFFNGLWVVIPVAMLWQSWNALVHFADTSSSKRKKKAH